MVEDTLELVTRFRARKDEKLWLDTQRRLCCFIQKERCAQKKMCTELLGTIGSRL